MPIPKKKKKRTYGQKIAQRAIGQRGAFEFANAADRRKDQDKPDWMIERQETGFRPPKKDPAEPKAVEGKILQTYFYRGPASFDTELVFIYGEKLTIPAIMDKNKAQAATSLLAVKIGEEEQRVGLSQPDMIAVWQIKRLTGFKAANDGLKSAELIGQVTMSEARVRSALERWSLQYGLTDVAPNMAAPLNGAEAIQKPWRSRGRHLGL